VEKPARYSQKVVRASRSARLKETGGDTRVRDLPAKLNRKRDSAPFPFRIEIEREDDGRFIAEIPTIPGVMVYGGTRGEAIEKVRVLALEVLADQARSPRRSRQVTSLFDVA
jgi:predicted RNase H-like HicB family nuclease